MGEIVINVKELMFKYGSFKALENISFKICRGEFIGLLGPNGSGKTTLLKCLCSLLKPYGSIYIDGLLISKYGIEELAKVFSYVSSETFPEAFNLSVFDVVSTGRTPHMKGVWWESRDDEVVICESMNLLNIAKLANRKIGELSSGERQRVRIAKALAQQPRILLVDEPTVHLDLKHQIEIMNILKELTRRGLTIIAALHDLNLASTYSDKIIVLNSGRIVAYGDPRKTLSEELIGKVYGVKVKIKWDSELGTPIIVPTIEQSNTKNNAY